MAPTLDATLGGASSNSYIDLATATALAQNMPFADDWNSTSDDDLVIALINATRWLETIDYQGSRCNLKNPQRLKWPRKDAQCDGITSDCVDIPYAIKEAEVVLAMAWISDSSVFPGVDGGSDSDLPAGLYVSKNQLGELVQEISAFPNATGSDCNSCSDPAIIRALPWLKDLLKCWLNNSGSGNARVIARVRS